MSRTASRFDIGPGAVLGSRYEIVGPHRQGGLSVAYEARDLDRGDRCEVQLFTAGLFETEAEAQEFASAWDPWRRVASTHVLAVREVALATRTTPMLVTDFPEGRSLRQDINERGRQEAAQVAALGAELLEALEAIHACGLVHGDVKPLTVWRARELAVLVDGGTTMGLWNAKDLGERTALIGTPYYAPVEQFGGDPPTVSSDLYNVATLLFELATGVQPWAGKSFLEVFQSKLSRTPPSVRERAPGVGVPAALEEAIRGGLHADWRDRYGSAKEFRERLEACA